MKNISAAICDDIAFFLYFYSYSILFCSALLHSWHLIPLFPQLLLHIALLGSAVLRYMMHTAAAETCSHQLISQDTALHVVSGPLVYKLILDEGYVLTQHLDPIDAFCVCPALRQNLIISICQKLRLLTHFYLPDFKPYQTHFPALVSWPPATSTAGSASWSQSSWALGHTCCHT